PSHMRFFSLILVVIVSVGCFPEETGFEKVPDDIIYHLYKLLPIQDAQALRYCNKNFCSKFPKDYIKSTVPKLLTLIYRDKRQDVLRLLSTKLTRSLIIKKSNSAIDQGFGSDVVRIKQTLLECRSFSEIDLFEQYDLRQHGFEAFWNFLVLFRNEVENMGLIRIAIEQDDIEAFNKAIESCKEAGYKFNEKSPEFTSFIEENGAVNIQENIFENGYFDAYDEEYE
ncbi:hypothetical protein ROZALSC1DRAFT_30285, partial [Rozella allomycis CSF55]